MNRKQMNHKPRPLGSFLLYWDPQFTEYFRSGTVIVKFVVRLFGSFIAHLRKEFFIELYPGLRDTVAVLSYAVKDNIGTGIDVPDSETFLFKISLIKLCSVLVDDDADAVIEGVFSFCGRTAKTVQVTLSFFSQHLNGRKHLFTVTLSPEIRHVVVGFVVDDPVTELS